MTLVGDVLLLPPGWLWLDAAWAVGWFGAVLATVPGYPGFGPKAGIGGSSAPGLAFALRGEIIAFYSECFDNATLGRAYARQPPGLRYTLVPLGLSIGPVLAATSVGYAVGVGARRARDRLRDR